MDSYAAKFIDVWFVNTTENDKWRNVIGNVVHVHDKW